MKKSVALGVAGLAVVAVTGGVMATTTSFAATNRPAGTHTVTIDASDIGSQPHGFGWDGGSDTINAQWLSA